MWYISVPSPHVLFEKKNAFSLGEEAEIESAGGGEA